MSLDNQNLQVMALPLLLGKFEPSKKLKDAKNFVNWNKNFVRSLKMFGREVFNYASAGRVPPEDEISAQSEQADQIIQTILDHSVDEDVLKRYETIPEAFGLGLYLMLVHDYGTMKPREKFIEVKKLKNNPSLKEIESFGDNVMHSLQGSEFLGLYYLASLDNSEAETRIFSNPNLNISLASVKDEVKDLVDAKAITANVANRHRHKGPPVCFNCNKKGHIAPNCPLKKEKEKSFETKAQPEPQAWSVALLSTASENDSTHYWIDSGATIHVSNNRAHFQTFEECDLSLEGIGKGSLPVYGIGSILFTLGNSTVRLDQVHYVPGAQKNLVSIGSAANKGVEFTFTRDAVLSNNVMVGKRVNNSLYEFMYKVVLPKDPIVACPATLHSRLGHPSDAVLNKLAKV